MKENMKLLLLTYLQENAGTFLSARTLSVELGISERTVYRYIKALNQDLALRGMEVISLPGVGYRLNQLGIKEQLSDLSMILEPEREAELECYIIEQLFFNQFLGIEAMLRKFYISEATLHRVLQSINEKYRGRRSRIGVKKGQIVIKGSQESIIQFFIGLFLSMEMQHKQDTFPSVFSRKQELVDKIKAIYLCYHLSSHHLSEFDDRILSWAVYILIFRYPKHSLSFSNPLESEQRLEFERLVTSVCDELIRLNGDEVNQLLIRITDLALSFFYTSELRDVRKFEQIQSNLIAHLRMVLKQKYFGIRIENGLLHTIEEKYAFELTIAGLLAYQLELQFDISFTKADIGFIALYLAMIHQQNRHFVNRIQTVLISESLSSGYLLKEELARTFPELDVYAVITEWEVEAFDFSECQLLISLIQQPTRPLEIPTCYFRNPIDYPELFQAELTEVIAKFGTVQNSQEILNLVPVMVFGNTEEEVIRELIYHQIGKNAQAEQLIKEVADREKITTTSLAHNIAIPHTLSKDLECSSIIVGIHGKGILWGDKQVQLIILSLFSDKDKAGGEIFRKLYHFATNRDIVEKTIQERTTYYLVHYLEGDSL